MVQQTSKGKHKALNMEKMIKSYAIKLYVQIWLFFKHQNGFNTIMYEIRKPELDNV